MRDCHRMKKYRIDKSKNIGNVIFVVEGGRPETGGTELRLLKKIFADILGYEVQELRRQCDEFIAHGTNPQYRVFALNLPKNQLTEMTDEALDTLYARIRDEFGIKPEDCPIFYLYDRDYLSYKPNELRGKYVVRYTDPYSNENGDIGQLLLSYPAIESYLLSCIQEDTYKQSFFLGKELKPELNRIAFSDSNVENVDLHQKIVDQVFSDDMDEDENRLIHSVNEMDKGLVNIGQGEYDLDNLAPTLLNVYDIQQKKCKSDRTFSLISLVAMAFLELGVIVECDEE